MTYAQFGELLDRLTEAVVRACLDRAVRIDVVAPILRSGAFPGAHLASRLGVSRLLPLQYKHTYELSSPIRRIFEPPTLAWSGPGDPTVLIADTNTVTGEVARCAVADVRAVWPRSRIFFASVVLDLSIETIHGVELIVAAERSNETRLLSLEAAANQGVSTHVHVFPWEDLQEQWREIQASQQEEEKECDQEILVR